MKSTGRRRDLGSDLFQPRSNAERPKDVASRKCLSCPVKDGAPRDVPVAGKLAAYLAPHRDGQSPRALTTRDKIGKR
jgi:hypothetical protein